jgi:hypothetical protein
MRDRRVKLKSQGAGAERSAEAFWASVIAAICALRVVAMVVTGFLGYEHKTPVRIENWRPEPTLR